MYVLSLRDLVTTVYICIVDSVSASQVERISTKVLGRMARDGRVGDPLTFRTVFSSFSSNLENTPSSKT